MCSLQNLEQHLIRGQQLKKNYCLKPDTFSQLYIHHFVWLSVQPTIRNRYHLRTGIFIVVI